MEWLKRLRAGNTDGSNQHVEAPWHWQVRSHDGYQREAALKTVVHHPRGDAIPAILERLNDWVPQVRVAAKNALVAHLRSEYFDAWIAAVPEICKLDRYRRAPHAESIAEIRAYFVGNGLINRLAAKLHSLDHTTAGFLFETVLQTKQPLPENLLAAALQLNRFSIAHRAFSRALDDEEKRDEIVARTIRSKNPAMRAEALRAAMRFHLSAGETMVMDSLSDRSPRVRSVAAFYAKQFSSSAEKLAHATMQTSDVSLLLLGLDRLLKIESGSASLIQLQSYTRHARAEVRLHAWNALLRVNPERSVDHVGEFLGDSSSKVRSAAMRALRGMTERVEREWAEARCDAMLQRSDRQGKQLVTALLQTLRHNGAWEQLAFALRYESMDSHQGNSRAPARDFYRDWLDRNGALAHAPSPQLAALIVERLQSQSNSSLVKKIQQKLADCVVAERK